MQAGGVGTQVVADDNSAVLVAIEQNAVIRVPRDDVPRSGRRSTDDNPATGSRIDVHTVLRVAQSLRTGDVGADVVAGHDVARVRFVQDDSHHVPRDDVAVGGRRAANGVIRRVLDGYSESIAQGVSAGGIGADQVAHQDVASTAVGKIDARAASKACEASAGDEVAADGVPGRSVDFDTHSIAHGNASRRIRAEVVDGDEVAAADFHRNAGKLELLEDQTSHGAVAGGDVQTAPRGGAVAALVQAVAADRDGAAVQHDQRCTRRIRRLSRAVDSHSCRDAGQGGKQVDGLRAGAGDVELDGLGAGVGVGVQDGLPQRTRPAVVGVGDRREGNMNGITWSRKGAGNVCRRDRRAAERAQGGGERVDAVVGPSECIVRGQAGQRIAACEMDRAEVVDNHVIRRVQGLDGETKGVARGDGRRRADHEPCYQVDLDGQCRAAAVAGRVGHGGRNRVRAVAVDGERADVSRRRTAVQGVGDTGHAARGVATDQSFDTGAGEESVVARFAAVGAAHARRSGVDLDGEGCAAAEAGVVGDRAHDRMRAIAADSEWADVAGRSATVQGIHGAGHAAGGVAGRQRLTASAREPTVAARRAAERAGHARRRAVDVDPEAVHGDIAGIIGGRDQDRVNTVAADGKRADVVGRRAAIQSVGNARQT